MKYKLGKEIWYNTIQFGALIQFSNYERIRSWKRLDKDGLPKQIAVYIGSSGYLVSSVRMPITQKVTQLKIHRLIATTFLPNPTNLPEVNHKDGNKLNNNPKNLEWCDKLHNMRHAIKNGLIKPCVGENKPQSKLTRKEVMEIFKSKISGRKLAPKYGVSFGIIYSIRNGLIWNCVTGMPKKYKSIIP